MLKPVKAGQCLCEYVGERVTFDQKVALQKSYTERKIDDYMFALEGDW